jgi:preprotein translocase subunit SecG
MQPAFFDIEAESPYLWNLVKNIPIMIYTILVILIAIICVLLILVVLMQSGQGGGLSGGLAGNMTTGSGNMIGARRTADFLSKATSVLGGAFLVLCLMANFAIDRQTTQQRSVIQQSGPIVPMDGQDFSLPAETPSAVPQTPPQGNDEDNNE